MQALSPAGSTPAKPRRIKPTRTSWTFYSPKPKPKKPQRRYSGIYAVYYSYQLSNSQPASTNDGIDASYLRSRLYDIKRTAIKLQMRLKGLESDIVEKEQRLQHEVTNNEAFYLHIMFLESKSSYLDESNNAARDVINVNLNYLNAQKSQICRIKRDIYQYYLQLSDLYAQKAKIERTQNLMVASGVRDTHFIDMIREAQLQKRLYAEYIAVLTRQNAELEREIERETAKLELLNSHTLQTSKVLVEKQHQANRARTDRFQCKQRQNEISRLCAQREALRREICEQRSKFCAKIERLAAQLQ